MTRSRMTFGALVTGVAVAVLGGLAPAAGATVVAPTITSPSTTHAATGSAVTVTGRAGAGATVVLHFHKAGTASSDYSIVRSVAASSAGSWSRPFTLDADYRVFATVGQGNPHSATVLFTHAAAPAPAPTSSCTATPSDANPGRGGTESIRVHGPASVGITVTAKYKTTDSTYRGSTNSAGDGAVTFAIGHPTAGYRVVVSVVAGAASCSTAFTPR